MQDIFSDLVKWVEKGEPFALATVIQTWRSSPRPVGSSLAISASGEMVGSVSGGCVEKDIVDKASEVLSTGSNQVLEIGVSNETAWEVGLSCGGRIEVLLEPFLAFTGENKTWNDLQGVVENNGEAVLITELNGKDHFLFGGKKAQDWDIPDEIKKFAEKAIDQKLSQVFEIDGSRYFALVFPKKPKMLLLGSAHITSEMIQLAKLHDFETIVVDPRDTFAGKTKLVEEPDQLHVEWPQYVLPHFDLDENTYAVILSHDPRIDDAALEILLPSGVAYIGALGSRKTHEKRLSRLRDKGFTEEQLERIHAPVGLDIGAMLPREIALSVMAEIVGVKNQRLEEMRVSKDMPTHNS